MRNIGGANVCPILTVADHQVFTQFAPVLKNIKHWVLILFHKLFDIADMCSFCQQNENSLSPFQSQQRLLTVLRSALSGNTPPRFQFQYRTKSQELGFWANGGILGLIWRHHNFLQKQQHQVVQNISPLGKFYLSKFPQSFHTLKEHNSHLLDLWWYDN